jgi:hypothetical protein
MVTVRSSLIACAILGLGGCSFSEQRTQAEALAERYFAAVRAGDLDALPALYSGRFLAVTPRDKLVAMLQEVKDRCGVPQSHSLERWTVQSHIGGEAGSRVTLVYEARYTTCGTTETLTIFEPDGGAAKIEGHHWQFNAPQPEAGRRGGTAT